MKERTDFKNYNFAVSLYIKRELRTLKRKLNSNLLSHVEKNLINARLLNLNGKTEEAIELLNKTTPQELFLKAQKYNVLSSIYDKNSKYQQAAVCNHNAYINYKMIEDNEGIFVSLLNLSINYSRLSLKELFDNFWNEAKKYSQSFANEASLIRVKVSYLSKLGNYQDAIVLLKELMNHREYQDVGNQSTYDNLLADILFRNQEFEESLELYKKLFKNKSALNRPRIIYEYEVLKSILSNKKLPSPPASLDSESEYFYLWQTLLYLQDGDPEYAQDQWLDLIKLNPDKYRPHFEFKDLGDKSNHFSQFLDFIKLKNKGLKLIKARKGSRVHLLLKLLQNSDLPLRKEVLIEKIWKIDYSPSYDSRFYKLIERARKNTQAQIRMENSTYTLA